jgi:parvulin-like peptidyl-prolyl isomerase
MTDKRRKLGKCIGGAALVALGWAAAHVAGGLWAQPLGQPAQPQLGKDVVAHVNNVPIMRHELGEELIARKGKQHLEMMINRKIIELAAQKEGLTVTPKEVEEDVADVMRGLQVKSPKDFEERLLKQRNSTFQEYVEDVVRPGILMRKLAEKDVTVTEEDLKKSFEANYGAKVDVRMILIPTESGKNMAFKVHAEATNKECKTVDDFIALARKYNTGHLAATAGKIRPINRHSALGEVEKVAFAMKDGEVSHVMSQPEGYIILFREKLLPADTSAKFDELRDMMHREIRRKKVEQNVRTVFNELKSRVVVRDYLNNKFDVEEVFRGSTPNGDGLPPIKDLRPVKP